LVPNSDYDLWLRLARDYPLMYVNKVTARWRVHGESLSGSLSIRNYNYARWDGLLFEKHLALCPAEFRSLTLSRIHASYARAALGYFYNDNYAEAHRLCLKSLQYKECQPVIWLYLLGASLPTGLIKFIKRLKRVVLQSARG
jgi:hypothetical protein